MIDEDLFDRQTYRHVYDPPRPAVSDSHTRLLERLETHGKLFFEELTPEEKAALSVLAARGQCRYNHAEGCYEEVLLG